MDTDSWLLLTFIFFVITSAYFACAESAFSAVNQLKIKSRAEDGDKKSKNAWYIINHFDKALTTLLIGINISHIASAAVATVWAARHFGSSDRVTMIGTFATTGIVFFFGEMIPKSLANDRSETVSRAFAGSLRFFMRLFTPLSAFFTWISGLCLRLFKAKEEPTYTEEELYDILDTIEEEGVVDEEQSDLLKSALEFGGTTAADVMTMREDIQAVEVSDTPEHILQMILKSRHSRLPVCDGGLDRIVGTLPVRAYMKTYLQNPQLTVRSLLIPPFFVDTNAKIDDLLAEMRQHKFYLAIVRDKEGKTAGLVTIEDFLEELVGEIWDEDDEVDDQFIKLGGNRFTVSPTLSVGEMYRRIGRECHDERLALRPMLSWVLERFGKLPEEEDSFTEGDVTVTVTRVEDGRVTELEVNIPNPNSEKEAETVSPEESAVADAPKAGGKPDAGKGTVTAHA